MSAPLTLVSLPDDAFLLVIAACGDEDDEGDGVPLFEAVMGLGCLSKGMRQQLYRLQPLVGVHAEPRRRAAFQSWEARGASRCCTRAI